MSDTEQIDAPSEEVEEKSEALDEQFAAADAGQDPNAEPPSVEELASELGWTPQDKFRGPAEKWKPADQFLRDGRKAERNLKRTVDELRQTLDSVAKTTGSIMQEKLAEREREVAARYQSAVEAGDAEGAWKAANEIRDIKDSARTAAQPIPQAPDEVTVAWAERNPWMKTHPLARQLAIDVAEMFAREGASAEVQTREAELVVRQQFPHLFQDGQQAPHVNGPRSRAAPRTPKGTGYKDMPKEAQAVADDLLDRGLIDDKERYARNYFAQAQKG